MDIQDIILVQRENNSTVIYTKQDSFTTSAGLGDIEAKLDPDVFLRSHKSYIINVSKIKKIEPYGRWTYIVAFKDIDKDALITADKYGGNQETFFLIARRTKQIKQVCAFIAQTCLICYRRKLTGASPRFPLHHGTGNPA